MRKLFSCIAVLLIYAFTPGLCEVAEIAVHFADTGDMHTSDDERHAEHGSSQGQDGECHTCFCHAPTAFLVTPAMATPATAMPDGELSPMAIDEGQIGGVIREFFRPPIA